MRLKVSHFLALVVVTAMTVGLFAGPASAKTHRMSAKQKAAVRHQLRRAIKKNPRLISSKRFIKKASLVNFKLPVTIRLRGSNLDGNIGPTNPSGAANPNAATIDLGPSLGKRAISLGGKLAAEIEFQDAYDGGALGNVNLTILPSSSKTLSSTSIPLLWNDQVSDPTTSWKAGLQGASNVGCGDFTGTSALPFSPFPGIPYYNHSGPPNFIPSGYPNTPQGYVPEVPGPDSIDKLAVNTSVSAASANDDVNNHLGPQPDPFPSEPTAPIGPPGVQDTVLRTNALSLAVAPTGTVYQDGTANGPSGSQNVVIGKSGGQANLFGDIPGKNWGIDVTVSLGTKINSIIREVDADASRPLLAGLPWISASFVCRQAWTGAVQNYIPDVRLTGSLKISPAITPDGKLRIAKATLSSSDFNPARVALAACLSPYSVFAPQNNASDGAVTAANSVPTAAGLQPSSSLPINDASAVGRAVPSGVNCNTAPTGLVQQAGFTGVPPVTDGAYTTTDDGSKVSVAGDLTVDNVSADVLIGDV